MTGVPAYDKVTLLNQFLCFSCSIYLMYWLAWEECAFYMQVVPFFCSICLMQEECSDEMQKKREGSWELEKSGVAV